MADSAERMRRKRDRERQEQLAAGQQDEVAEWRARGYEKEQGPSDGQPHVMVAAWCEGLWQRYADDDAQRRARLTGRAEVTDETIAALERVVAGR